MPGIAQSISTTAKSAVCHLIPLSRCNHCSGFPQQNNAISNGGRKNNAKVWNNCNHLRDVIEVRSGNNVHIPIAKSVSTPIRESHTIRLIRVEVFCLFIFYCIFCLFFRYILLAKNLCSCPLLPYCCRNCKVTDTNCIR